jgi:choloylglycine hydrolase
MTNSPVFEDQLAINRYWDIIGGNRMLPGTINAADRYVRASYLLKGTPKFEDRAMATGAAIGILRAVGVPLGMEDPDHPNISATLWRTLYDHEKKRMYFDDAHKPAVFWVDLDNMDFSEGKPIIGVSTNRSEPLFGEISGEMKPMDPFKWI